MNDLVHQNFITKENAKTGKKNENFIQDGFEVSGSEDAKEASCFIKSQVKLNNSK